MCVLISDRLCTKDIDDIFIKFLILFNLLFSIFGVAEKNTGILSLIDYPGQNTLGALNLIALPHVVSTYKGRMQALRLLYVATFVLFLFHNIGFTNIFCTALMAAWYLLNAIRSKISLKSVKNKRKFYILIPMVIAVLIVIFFVNKNVQSVYLDFLFKMDRDRYAILSQAIYRISKAIPKELIWGRGDNNYYMLTGRYVVAHNFIIEVITF